MLIFLKTLALDNEAHIDADITRERERERELVVLTGKNQMQDLHGSTE